MTRDSKIVEHKYIEHYPPDTTAALFWLKNRRPEQWRDLQRVDAAHGHYILSEIPMDEAAWARERATLIGEQDKTIEHEPAK